MEPCTLCTFTSARDKKGKGTCSAGSPHSHTPNSGIMVLLLFTDPVAIVNHDYSYSYSISYSSSLFIIIPYSLFTIHYYSLYS